MGLYASFTPEDLGYPESLETEVLGVHLEVPVDYSAALEGFVDTFLAVSTSLVPVDTGFLQSTLDAGSSGDDAYAEASAEYAQYVEYGTWKMEAQPYFEPAVEAGLAAFQALAGEAVDEAQREMEDILQGMIDAFTASAETMGDFLGGLAMAAVAYIILFPILVNLYGIMESLTGDKNVGYGGISSMVDIIIT